MGTHVINHYDGLDQSSELTPAARLTASSTWSLPSGSSYYALSPIKRGLDLIVCIPALIVFAPLMALIALLLRFSGPVLFKQERIGIGGRKFSILKFRTMSVDAERRLAVMLAQDPEARRE